MSISDADVRDLTKDELLYVGGGEPVLNVNVNCSGGSCAGANLTVIAEAAAKTGAAAWIATGASVVIATGTVFLVIVGIQANRIAYRARSRGRGVPPELNRV